MRVSLLLAGYAVGTIAPSVSGVGVGIEVEFPASALHDPDRRGVCQCPSIETRVKKGTGHMNFLYS